MSDDLDDLKRALDAATPAPDPDKRAENIALAMKNFDALQGNGVAARHTSDRPKEGPVKGVMKMLTKTLSSRGVLTATTALVAVAMVALIPVLQDMPGPKGPGLTVTESDAVHETGSKGALEPVILPDAATEEAPEDEAVIVFDDAAASNIAPAPSVQSRAAAPAAGGAFMKAEGPITLPAPPPSDSIIAPEADTEAFPQAEANPIKVTAEDPVSTFSIDVDTASWSIIRNSLTAGYLPPKEAVRIEEMVNYFPYDYPAPEGDAPFRASVGVSDSPWRAGTQIVHIGLQGALPATRPAMNLVFLIDTSGSMDQPNKLPLLKQSFRLMLGQLGAEDSVSIVTYAGSAGRVLDPTPATERDTILAALDNLQAGGGTAGQAGLQQAYDTAKEMTEDGEVSRVILATDGDFNIGISDPDALKDFIATQRDSGTYLSVLGFGRGNLDDATMQALAQTGNGMAAYIDTLSEAQKVLVDQLTGALVPIADDVKIQVEFNPSTVAEYRLIGYETRALRREDFNNDKVDAGEIGAGHQVTAIYEITPVGSDARMTDPLRYGAQTVTSDSTELGFLRLRYKAPGADDSQLIETPITKGTAPLPDADFALAVAGFGQLLQGSDLLGNFGYDEAIALAQSARGDDPYGYRQEAVTLMRLAQSLSK
ncbi:vWA domain-containing protein [Primorskyibacter sp. 2E233]|uniref:vWA domain-containing protein n=1 Tax=Primorskyibacter sp. 2E233 TaxID=3413431 RepID=UPI003BF3C68C